MAGVTPYQIIAGPADVYIAPAAEAFPAINATPAGNFVALGKTEGGVAVRHTQNIELISTDQTTGPLKGIRTEEGLEIEFSLAELTLENYRKAINDATLTTGGSPQTKSFKLHRGRNVTRHTLLVRGDSPYGAWNLQYEVPIVIQTDEPEVEFTKEDKSVLHCTFIALEDLTQPTEDDRFGVVRAQSA